MSDPHGSRDVVEVLAMEGGGQMVTFECPGCGCNHGVTVGCKNGMGAQWTWNGDATRPTISPSILMRIRYASPLRRGVVCHSFVRDGRIEFLSDCTHELAGKTVDLPLVAK
jgi:hypothetical protein